MTVEAEIFSFNLRKLMHIHDLSIFELAEVLKVSRLEAYRYKTGEEVPDKGKQKKIADYLGVTVEWLNKPATIYH